MLNPFQIFEGSSTPAGLYARKKWLGREDASFQTDFDAAAARLLSQQGPDGFWDGSTQETIRRLFGLHLTVRDATPAIHKALDHLAKEISTPNRLKEPRLTDPSTFDGLPFVPGHPARYVQSAFLFLATIFERQDDSTVQAGYEDLLSGLIPDRWFRHHPADLNNAMRALVVHRRYASHPKVAEIVGVLGRHQSPDGTWGKVVPFYQMTNALAHLDRQTADGQLDRAFERLRRTQNDDGTWGRRQREWNTFLVIHALRNRGLL